MKVLMASAEMAPIARVGGMAEAVAGLVRQLRRDGVEVTVALPDYGGVALADERPLPLDLPDWVGPAAARIGTPTGGTAVGSGSAIDGPGPLDGPGPVDGEAPPDGRAPVDGEAPPDGDGQGPLVLIDAPGMAKPHPYNDEVGQAFPDNDRRFFSFSAGVAALAADMEPDVLHLHDWHSAAALGLLSDPPPSVLSIHTLAYQGIAGPEWLGVLRRSPHLFSWYGNMNPLLGAIQLADRVATVSPNYAREILTERHGMGLHLQLAALGDRLTGIRNGIDVDDWNPSTDPNLVANFSATNIRGKAANRRALIEAFGLSGETNRPIIGMVSRLVEQKGIDLAADLARFLDRIPAALVILGSGDAPLVQTLQDVTNRFPGQVGFQPGYKAALSHIIFAGSDLLLMPSRFEPCGLAQMQAMAYGTIPVVTDVGGLHDTVIDADADPARGTGFVSRSVDSAGMVDAVHRAVRAWSSTRRRAEIRRRGMAGDWSWAAPAADYRAIYREIIER